MTEYLIKVNTKLINFEVKKNENQYDTHCLSYQRNYGNWCGYMGGFTPDEEKTDIEIINDCFESFKKRNEYNEQEIGIVKGFINELQTPQLELF